LEINGEKITMENPMANILQKFKAGEEINLKALRDRKEMIIKVRLGERD
jgi:S1-C subfamily serine protease